MQPFIRTELFDGVLTVCLQRPEQKNAMLVEMRAPLAEIFEHAAVAQDIRAVLLMGDGPDFCAGADVKEMGRGGLADATNRTQLMQRLMSAVVHCPKPVVCAVSGFALGMGFSLALAGDVVIASDSARMGFVQQKIGLPPDAGAVWLLGRQLGTTRAKELVFSARLVEAQEAFQLGLVESVVAPDQLLQAARAKAHWLAGCPTVCLSMAKRMFELAAVSTFDEFMAHERYAVPLSLTSTDFREGVAAFKEKRAPNWTGT
ncbi:MAG: enoyl-CoA hydratase/isomerase family protein [Hydrogenophaga sp.]|uniref:enoyl-CoA hydratase/isomerase family protein n=1 Tax=Hydrogenophaga sp. TaxID=1904254 RepID=UPI00403536BB